MNKKEKGKFFQQIAEEYLKRKKYKIIDRNFLWKKGEIDIIAERDNKIIFIEVRGKESEDIKGYETVNLEKQKRIIETAKFYLESKNLYGKKDVRFDVISINLKDEEIELEHFENAFMEE
ncbi:MAG: YraN family protein [candidate division WOR-3 bacterium]